MKKPFFEMRKLDPEACDGHTYRYTFCSSATILLYLGGLFNRTIYSSRFIYPTQNIEDIIDWNKYKTQSFQIKKTKYPKDSKKRK